jgi:hypothetical protein
MWPRISLEDMISPDGEIADMLARREHGDGWDSLTAHDMIAAYNRWRTLIELDNGGHTNARRRALLAEARSEWQRALSDAETPKARTNLPVEVGFV